ncbi:hypothetical protein FS837_005720 [Tulasnella sp. UAMH 9824]|nr:hypothetical protein FS837_005720 [Tulasnella sp. UAMH 9824]
MDPSQVQTPANPASQIQPSANPVSPWEVPQVPDGLKFTTKLLEGVLDLGMKSPNHSLKAQHLLSRGIEVLISIQHFLQSGEKSLLETLETLNDLQATEKSVPIGLGTRLMLITELSVLTESIAILDEDTKKADFHPCDRAVMSSWHLNRNTFTAKLEELADTGPKKNDDRWTIVMRDVVRADDLSFATRLSNDVEKNCTDADAKKAVKDIVASLEQTESATKAEEKTRTDSILGIMCLADETAQTDRPNDSVVRVVTDMAKQLQEPDPEKKKWKSISDRLHGLPVCRKVEKPLLLHRGEYTIPDIIEDAHAEILSSSTILGDLLPFGTESPLEEPEKVEKHVKKIVGAMTEATRNLKTLVEKKKSFDEVKGKKTENQILYATKRLLGDTAMAITPILDLEEVKKHVPKVTASAFEFVNTLTTFDGTTEGAWRRKLLQSLAKTADVLKRFGALDTNDARGEGGRASARPPIDAQVPEGNQGTQDSPQNEEEGDG